MTLGLFLATITAAIGAGWLARDLFGKPRKRQMPPSGSALQKYDPVWANASHVKEMRK